MDLLEHPLEAVAFRLYSLPIPEASATGAAAWTCLAAVLAAAAAAGLWRLRSSAPTAAAVAVSNTKPLELDPSRAAAEVSSSPEPSRPSSLWSPEPAAAWASSTASSPKERYTAYYRDAGCVGCCDEDGDENDEEDDDVAEEHEDGGDRDVFLAGDGADPFGWEVVRSLPLPRSPTAAETGRRYRRSPTAALSVVQLWDRGAGGGLTPTASPRRRGRGVSGTVSAF